ncbi:MAG TPA: hypothetical protein VFB68_18105 [Xanthobacteraceae bacterium]|nr:hypothetical protein [Xanthobacteraceae bacterium]
MKACSHQPVARGPALAAPRSFCAPALLAAYALGATLWAPAIVLIAGQFEGAFVRFIPGFPFAGVARMLALVWVLRFAFYLVGAWRGADYGYGINGVIVSANLTLAEKAQRIARDWFGVLLIAVWIGFAAVALLALTGGR